MVAEGLRVVARQLMVEAGRIDLLAIDPAGRWVVVEIKAGKLGREVIAQALDYAASVSALPDDDLRAHVSGYLAQHPVADADGFLNAIFNTPTTEPRDVYIIVAGTGRDPSLDRLAHYLADRYDVPVRAVTFEVLALSDGSRILVREVAETVGPPPSPGPGVDDVVAKADAVGLGGPFRTLIAAARRHDLYLHPYKYSIMVTPQAHHGRMLFTMWAKPGGSDAQPFYLSAEAFNEFFGFEEDDVRAALGADSYHALDEAVAERVSQGLDRLFKEPVEDSTV